MAREAIPAEIKRAVLVEAGHRCAIPTCRATTTEIAHIIPWSETQDNSFENLIALCPNCHTRYDQKKEIDRTSIQVYKKNLRANDRMFAETFLLGDQDTEIRNRKQPILTIHYWKYDCTIQELLLHTAERDGPTHCHTILDIIVDGTSIFDGEKLCIPNGSDSSVASSKPYCLVKIDWDAGSKVQFRFDQLGGGTGYQLFISGVLR